MEVLFITHYSEVYGANKSMIALVLDLRDRYNIVPTIVIPQRGPITEELEKYQIKYKVIRFYQWSKVESINFKDYIKIIYNRLVVPYQIVRICGSHFDLIHSNSSVIECGQYVANKMKKPHIWHLREYGSFDYNRHYILPIHYVNRIMKKATKLVCISKSIQDYYSKYICPDGKYVQIYNGVAISHLYDDRIKASEKINFCCIGLIFQGKGQYEIVQAVKMLVEKYNDRNFCVHFIGGEDEVYGNKIRNYVHNNHLGDYIKFWGYQSDVGSILQKMDVGIMASTKEAFGRVTVEYMLAHMPVIGSNAGGTVEIIEDGVNGTFFDREDINSLATKMHEYTINRDKVIEQGNAAYVIANERFSVSKNTDSIYTLYREATHFATTK